MTLARPTIAITLGDPAGIGPEIVLNMLQQPSVSEMADIVVLADEQELQTDVSQLTSNQIRPGSIRVLEDGTADVSIPVKQSSVAAGERSLHQLKRGITLARDGDIDALVFAPLNKHSLHLAGMNHDDDLRWFAEQLAHDGTVSEINILPNLWTSRVTSHMAMSQVSNGVTAERVHAVITILHYALVGSGNAAPRLAVSALNPHAGEGGRFGRDEIDDIAPGIAAAVSEGIDATGPHPADTVFLAARRGKFDGVVTMYHDQGQIAMKLIGFDRGVTLLGGLPIVVTTPAHGTAFDLVGTGNASSSALEEAFAIAASIAAARMNQ